jgi:hypothetical protein
LAPLEAGLGVESGVESTNSSISNESSIVR